MGVQIPRGIHSKVPEKDVVRAVEAIPWRGVSQAGAAEGMPDRGRSSDVGSRAHDDCDTTEILGIAGNWIYEGQERDPSGPSVWGEATKFCWSALLGPRILCLDGWTR